jgi:hypothetical protein
MAALVLSVLMVLTMVVPIVVVGRAGTSRAMTTTDMVMVVTFTTSLVGQVVALVLGLVGALQRKRRRLFGIIGTAIAFIALVVILGRPLLGW